MAEGMKNGVRMYQRIRRYINKIYLYGFLTRKDFARMNNGSAKDYDAGVKLIKELFREEGFNKKRGLRSVRRQYYTSGDLRLQDSYMLCQLDPEDMAEYLHILNIARLRPGIANRFARRLRGQDLSDSSVGTAYNRLQKLHRYGGLQKRGKTYTLAQDGLDALSDRQMGELYEYVRFCSRTAYPRVAAGMLRRTLERKLAERGLRADADAPFLLRRHANFHVLDEELVYALSRYMRDRRWVSFDGRLRLPLVLRVDTQMGRWYALCADGDGGTAIERLANVEALQPEEKTETPRRWEEFRQTVTEAYRHVLFSGQNEKPVTVCAKLEFGANPGLRNQFLRELRIGKIVTRDGAEYYEAEVSDPLELRPLLRAYGAYLRILPGEHTLREDLREHYALMLKALEEDAV